ncbi:TRAP transporter large permease subunit, partial [Escherichia coli]
RFDVFAGKKSAQIREILISESAWEEMTCLFAPSLILTPVLMPLVKEAGIDPIYFGVMFIINCSIGLITPPIGNVLNVISGVAKLKFDDAVRGVFPYVLVLYSLLVVFVFIPDLIILPLKWIN